MLNLKKLVFTLLLLFAGQKAYAHPHIWVATDLTLLTENSKIMGLGVKWQFDYMYSSAFMLDNDLNKYGTLDEEEQEIIQEQVMRDAVFRLRPFIMLYFNNLKVNKYTFENLKISYNKKLEQVEYNFNIKLTEPQKLKGLHKLAILDEEYYVGFEQSYNFKIPNNCSFELEEDMSMTVYDGLINPEVYTLSCK